MKDKNNNKLACAANDSPNDLLAEFQGELAFLDTSSVQIANNGLIVEAPACPIILTLPLPAAKIAAAEMKSSEHNVESFCAEALNQVIRLHQHLVDLELEIFDATQFAEFAVKIDGIMSMAKMLGLHKLSHFCQLCHIVAYKASLIQNPTLSRLTLEILWDALDILKELILEVRSEKPSSDFKGLNIEAFTHRLHWLSNKYTHYQQVKAINKKHSYLSQECIDELIKLLGID